MEGGGGGWGEGETETATEGEHEGEMVEVECGVWRVRRGVLVAGARVGLIGCGVVWYHRLIAGGAGRGRRVPISSPTRILTD